MIAKRYRLSEREVKRVLVRGKPFFSWMLAASALPSRELRLRTGIILSGKHVDTAIDRNFFRRRFYDTLAPLCEKLRIDLVVRAKKGVKLARRDPACVASFDRDMATLVSTLPV